MKIIVSILLCSFILFVFGCSNGSNFKNESSCIRGETTIFYEETTSIWETICEPCHYYRGGLSDFLSVLDQDGMAWTPEGSVTWQDIKEMRPFLEWTRKRRTIPIVVPAVEAFYVDWVETVENENHYFFRLTCDFADATNDRITFRIHIQPLSESQERLSLKELIAQQNIEFPGQAMAEHVSSKYGAYYSFIQDTNKSPVAFFLYRDCLISVYDMSCEQWQDHTLELFDLKEYVCGEKISN